MRADKLSAVFNEMLRLDRDVLVETFFDHTTFVFSEDIDICPTTLKIYKDKYGLGVVVLEITVPTTPSQCP